MTDKIITPRGVLHKGRFFWAGGMATRVGQEVVLDDLGVVDTPELVVTFKDKTEQLAECRHQASRNPALKGAFERALRSSGRYKAMLEKVMTPKVTP